MPFAMKNGKFMGSVKVGPKGQIVIPKEVRQMFGIYPGDTMILLADAEKGIALERYEVFSHFAGKAREIYPEHPETESMEFAQDIKNLKEDE